MIVLLMVVGSGAALAQRAVQAPSQTTRPVANPQQSDTLSVNVNGTASTTDTLTVYGSTAPDTVAYNPGAATPNLANVFTVLNHLFKYVYALRLVGKRMKAENQRLYYTFKYVLFGALIYWIVA